MEISIGRDKLIDWLDRLRYMANVCPDPLTAVDMRTLAAEMEVMAESGDIKEKV